jgi:hypothetical protein
MSMLKRKAPFLVAMIGAVLAMVGSVAPPAASAEPANPAPLATFNVPTSWTATVVGSISTTTPNEASKFDLLYTGTEGSCGPDPSLLVPGIVTCNSAVGSTVSGTLTGLFFDCADNTYTVTKPVSQGGVVFMTAPDPHDPQVDFGQVQTVGANTDVYTTPECPTNKNSLGFTIDTTNPSDCSSFTLSPLTPAVSGSCGGTDFLGEKYSFTFKISVSYCGSTPPTALAVRAASAAAGGDSVIFDPVRNSDTPAGMPDRIPPRVVTKVKLVANLTCPDAKVVISSKGGPKDGKVLINGQKTFTLPHNSGKFPVTLEVKGAVANGVAQETAVDEGAHLRLVATEICGVCGPGQVIGQSEPFAVSAIPINPVFTYLGPETGPWRGMAVKFTWFSDSGKQWRQDLNGASIGELIQDVKGPSSGVADKMYPANDFALEDENATATSYILFQELGTFTIADQVLIFVDQRAFPSNDMSHPDVQYIFAVKNSGYVITQAKEGDIDLPGHPLVVVSDRVGKALNILGKVDWLPAGLKRASQAGATDPAQDFKLIQDFRTGHVISRP